MDASSSHGYGPRYGDNRHPLTGGSRSASNLPLTRYAQAAPAYDFPAAQRHGSVSLVESSSWPGTVSTPPSSLPSGPQRAENHGKRTNSQHGPRTTASGLDAAMSGNQNRLAGDEVEQQPADDISPVQKDFEHDPAHAFWTWSVESQNWYHKDRSTGEVLWAPLQLD